MPSGRIQGLDGLRAVAISLVLADHMVVSAVTNGTGEIAPALGWLGVNVFFVISGFLITTLLLREQDRRGGMDLQRFYQRRALRILPVFYLYIGVVALARAAGWLHFGWHDLLAPSLFAGNLVSRHSWVLGHFWSLSAEEQFYLLWPAVLLFAGRRRAALVAAAVWLLSPLWFLLCWHSGLPTLGAWFVDEQFIAAGCLLALGHGWLHQQAWYRSLLTPGAAVLWLATLAALTAVARGTGGGHLARLAMVPLALLLALLADAAMTAPAIGRRLDWRPLAWLGTLSYSLYVWQELFFQAGSGLAAPWNLPAAVAAACLSYYGWERYFLRLKGKYQPRMAGVRVSAATAGRS
ncbi:MAG TPA: acyltransferase [Terriglobales bacterium]